MSKKPTAAKAPEMQPMPAECCMTCRYFLLPESLCRRFPPQLIVTRREKPDKAWWQGGFPQMQPTGWCGEWKARLAS